MHEKIATQLLCLISAEYDFLIETKYKKQMNAFLQVCKYSIYLQFY